ncbi:hypothetical protein L1049_010616 [Liquidambar formosana]|uniref:Uncharacterized protein n=1 Tax=Liquidambar formosana TaxID=63359 RepID=A0AAP0NBU0_LIQFO
MDGERGSEMGTGGIINLNPTEPCGGSNWSGIEVEDLEVEEAYFRGRKLQGATIPLPEGYSGFVLGKKSPDNRKLTDISEEDLNRWETNAKFQSITFWNHDSLPSQDDTNLRSFHWFAVAKALHKPVTAEDLASASTITQKWK